MRRRGRHTLKHAGPDRVTVDELQLRFEEAEDDTTPGWWWIEDWPDVRPPMVDVMADGLADEDLSITVDRRPIPDGPPYLYGQDFHLAKPALVMDPPVDHTPGVSVSELQRFRDRLADIEPLIHELTEKP